MKKLGISFLMAASLAFFAACDKTGTTNGTPTDSTHTDTAHVDSNTAKVTHGQVSGTVTFQGKECPPNAKDKVTLFCSGPYPGYDVTFLLKNDETKTPVTVKTDAAGKYTADLPAGDYVVYTQSGIDVTRDKIANPVTVKGNESVTLDLRVHTGIQ